MLSFEPTLNKCQSCLPYQLTVCYMYVLISGSVNSFNNKSDVTSALKCLSATRWHIRPLNTNVTRITRKSWTFSFFIIISYVTEARSIMSLLFLYNLYNTWQYALLSYHPTVQGHGGHQQKQRFFTAKNGMASRMGLYIIFSLVYCILSRYYLYPICSRLIYHNLFT